MKPDPPITPERIEAALDKLSIIMAEMNEKASSLLPLYERLERELASSRSKENKLASALDRAKRARGSA